MQGLGALLSGMYPIDGYIDLAVLQDIFGAIVEASEGTDVMLQLEAVGVASGRGSQQTAVPDIATLSAAAPPAVAPAPIPIDAGRPANQREAEDEMNSNLQSLVPEAGSNVMQHAHGEPRRSLGDGKLDVVGKPNTLTSALPPDSVAPQNREAAAGRDSELSKYLGSSLQVGLKPHLAACSGKSLVVQSDDEAHDLDSIIHPVARRAHTTRGSTHCCQEN